MRVFNATGCIMRGQGLVVGERSPCKEMMLKVRFDA